MGACILISVKDSMSLPQPQTNPNDGQSQSYCRESIAQELDRIEQNIIRLETSDVRLEKKRKQSEITTDISESSETVIEGSTSTKKSRFYQKQDKTSQYTVKSFEEKLALPKTCVYSSKIKETERKHLKSSSSSKKPKKIRSHSNSSTKHKHDQGIATDKPHKKKNGEEIKIVVDIFQRNSLSTTQHKASTREELHLQCKNKTIFDDWIQYSDISISVDEKLNIRESILNKDLNSLQGHLLPKIEENEILDPTNSLLPNNQFKDGHRKVEFKDGSSYEGEFKHGKKNGKGKLVWKGGVYKGYWDNNRMNGQGEIIFDNGEVFQGHFTQHQAQGHGVFYFKDMSVYNGNWRDNKQNGQGVHQWSNNDHYTGNWVQGKKEGFGELMYQDGSYYRGIFQDNQWQGEGEFDWRGHYNYKGHWQHNKKQGWGVQTFPNGDIYQGPFFDDKMEGKGQLTHSDGTIQKGLWEKGKKEGIIEEIKPDGKIITRFWKYGKLMTE